MLTIPLILMVYGLFLRNSAPSLILSLAENLASSNSYIAEQEKLKEKLGFIPNTKVMNEKLGIMPTSKVLPPKPADVILEHSLINNLMILFTEHNYMA